MTCSGEVIHLGTKQVIVCEWVIGIIHSFDLFNSTDSFKNGTNDCLCNWVFWIIHSICSTALIDSGMKQVIIHEWVIWIIHSVDLYIRTDLFVNGTSDCLYEWVIWFFLKHRIIDSTVCSKHEVIHVQNKWLSLRDWIIHWTVFLKLPIHSGPKQVNAFISESLNYSHSRLITNAFIQEQMNLAVCMCALKESLWYQILHLSN